MNTRADFLKREMIPLLDPDETILNTGTVFTGPFFLSSLLGVVGELLRTHYYAVLTTKRLVLIKTGMGFTGVKTENRGVIYFPISELSRIKTGGMLNQKTLTLYRKDGTSTMFRFNTMAKQVEGQKVFCSEVPKRLQEMVQVNREK